MKPSCVIALHGLGASGDDLVFLPKMLGVAEANWLFPDAPELPITWNAGMRMPAWFDIVGLSPKDPVDHAGIMRSVAVVQQLIEQQIQQGVLPEKIVLLGFSQGGVIALYAALASRFRLGGVVGLSTWLPSDDKLTELTSEQKQTPIWLGHGHDDEIVPLAAAERTLARLTDLSHADHVLHRYAMAHTIVPEELQDLEGWLTALP
ncbi:MAG: alpha/beta hydrolase fold domain-containing protein [Proteobacteria bacterium]|nr:alpha/beta hydrolase fold domain-containing protein [Pseudomonadota bacterium]